MSHFSVLVVGEDVDGQLAPFHEFESTGRNDQYVVDVDETAKLQAEYAEHEVRVVRCLSDGSLHRLFDEAGRWKPEFSREEPRFLGDKHNREAFAPEGYELAKVFAPELMTFREFVKHRTDRAELEEGTEPYFGDEEGAGPHKYGYTVIRGDVLATPDSALAAAATVVRTVRRTNSNKKWDWYAIGGRWTGFFKLKRLPSGGYPPSLTGEPGLLTKKASLGYADQAFKRDIDFDGMRAESAIEASLRWDRARRIVGLDATWASWKTVLATAKESGAKNYGAVARDEYWNQAAVKALRDSKEREYAFDIDDWLALPMGEYVERQTLRLVSPYAVLFGGEWTARGEMGWFGMSDDDGDPLVWYRKANELLDALPDDALLTIVDCHI